MEKSNNTTEGADSPLIVEGMSPLDVLLARLSLTQGQFCTELGVSPSAYKRWREKGIVTKLNHLQAKKFDSMLRRVGLSIQDLPDDVRRHDTQKAPE
jgi:hypothetical protein